MKYLIGILLICLSCLMPVHQVFSKTVVVVAKNTLINSLDKQAVSNIFLARTSRYENGQKAIPIEIKSNETRADFYRQISGKTPAQLNSYWTTLVFTGKGKPPRAYASQSDVLSRLESQPGAITYLPLSEVTDDMKVLYAFD